MRISFLIRSLERGGSERQLIELARGLSTRGHAVSVLVFYGGGVLEEELVKSHISVIDLKKKSRWDIIGFFWRLLKNIKKERPHILHSYLGTENTVAVLLKIFLPGLKIVWGIRSAGMDLNAYDWLSRLINRIETRLSRYADLIICNSQKGQEHIISYGFPAAKIRVINNGIDTKRFIPVPEEGKILRKQWNISNDQLLVGIVARLDPMKDHITFLRAAQIVLQKHKDVFFVSIGDDPLGKKAELLHRCHALGISDQVIWIDGLDRIEGAYSAIDVLVSSSCSEGFSNVIAEAMACGKPCVVTDVGDSRLIVGQTGIVVPPRNPHALAEACSKMIQKINEQDNLLITENCRERIEQYFSVELMVKNTEEALMDLW
jgi:glycosyltransferase involved in cell wall biosynthesis